MSNTPQSKDGSVRLEYVGIIDAYARRNLSIEEIDVFVSILDAIHKSDFRAVRQYLSIERQHASNVVGSITAPFSQSKSNRKSKST